MPKLIQVPIYPGGRNSDRTENELGVSQHIEVLNADIGKLGEWKKRDYYKKLNYDIIYDYGGGTLSVGKILYAVEHRGWLIIYTDYPSFFRVKIDSNGDYIAGPAVGVSSIITPPADIGALLTTDEIIWVERGNMLRAMIVSQQTYFKISFHDLKTILTPDQTLLHTYAQNSLKDEVNDLVLGESRDLSIESVGALRSVPDVGDPRTANFSTTEFAHHFYAWKTFPSPVTSDDTSGASFYVGVGVIDETGQLFPIKSLTGSYGAGSLVYQGYISNEDDKIAEALGFEFQINKVAVMSGSIQSIVIFGARDQDAIIWGTKNNGGRKIEMLDPNFTWRLIDELPVANGLFEEYKKYFTEHAYNPAQSGFAMAMPTSFSMAWTYSADAGHLYGQIDYDSKFWTLVPHLAVGVWIEIFMDDGSHVPPTYITSAVYGTGTFNSKFVTFTTNDTMASIEDGATGFTKLGNAFTVRVYKNFYQDLSNANFLHAHFVADMRAWTELPLIQDVYPYNIFAKDFFPDLDLFQIAGERSYALTPLDLEKDYLRYSAPGQYDMLPEDQLMEVGTVEVYDIIPRRNAIALVTDAGIIQGSLVSGVFNQDISFSRAGAIKRGAYTVIDDLIFFLGHYDLFMNNGNTNNALLEAGENRDYYQGELNVSLAQIGYDNINNQLLIITSLGMMLVYDFRTSQVFIHNAKINGGASLISFFNTEDGELRFIADDGDIYKLFPDSTVFGETRVIINTRLLDAQRRYKTKKLKEIRIPIKGISNGLQVILKDRDDGRTKTMDIDTSTTTEFHEYRLFPGFMFRSLEIQIDDAPASPRSENNFQIKMLNVVIQTW